MSVVNTRLGGRTFASHSTRGARIGRDRPLEESWTQFRQRLPADARHLLERMGDRGGVGRERPENLLCAETGDGDRIRQQIAAKRRQMGQADPVRMLPNFARALSGRGDHAVGRMMQVGAQPQAMGEDEDPMLLLEG